MTTAYVEVVALHVDQGMGNLIRFYNAANELTNVVIADLGSKTRARGFGEEAVEVVADAIGQLPDPKIDAIILSHRDDDHWNLLTDLRGLIRDRFGRIEVDRIVYGGRSWKEGLDELNAWKKAFRCPLVPFRRPHTDYENPAKPHVSFSVAGADFLFLAVNAECTYNPPNSTSAVTVLQFGTAHAVLPGDATVETAKFILEKVFRKPGGRDVTRPCVILQVPHHGALATISKKHGTTNPDLSIGREFAEAIAAQRVVASAGFHSQYHHPFDIVLDMFGSNAIQEAKHTFVAWRPARGKWQSYNEARALYTTVENLQGDRAHWEFRLYPTGEVLPRLVYRTATPSTERYPARPRAELL